MVNLDYRDYISPIQVEQYVRLIGDGYTYIKDKEDSFIVGSNHNDTSYYNTRPHIIEIKTNGDMVYTYF